LITSRKRAPTILGLTLGDSYDYRVTVELIDGTTMSGKFLSAAKYEEGQVITVQGRRCLVSDVLPVPGTRPGAPRIVNVHCLAVDD
jgi:hypothetical protein